MSDAPLLGGLTWDEVARSRRPRRLKRGRQFDGDLRAAERAAVAAADRMGMAVRCVRDDLRRVAYLWVQFVDCELPLGDPCPRCGGREIVKTHAHFARCEICDGRLVIVAPVAHEEESEVERPTPAEEKSERKRRRLLERQLDSFDDVRLVFDADESGEHEEVWYGRARQRGEEVLIRVVYPLREGTRQPHPDRPDRELHYVAAWHLPPIERAAELGLLGE